MITALVDRPHEINTKTGNLGALAHTLAPKTAFRVLHLAYQVFPDSSAARGERQARDREREAALPHGRPLVIAGGSNPSGLREQVRDALVVATIVTVLNLCCSCR